MRKRILSILLCCVMLVGLLPTAAYAESDSNTADITGTGSADDPYLIYTAEGLKQFRDIVNGSNGQTQNTGAHAKLMNDITLNDGTFDENGSWNKSGTPDEWEPIGWYKDISDRASYSGTFDGQGFTIHGLYVTGKRLHAGLFGHAQGATIKNVTVDGYVSVSGDFSGDGLASAYVGGIVGGAEDTKMEGCTNLCTVKSACISVETGSYAGGIAGYVTRSSLNPSVTNCHNGGKVILSGDYDTLYVGGIAGASNVPVSGCYNTGAIEAVSAKTDLNRFCAGGVIGSVDSSTEVTNCYNAGTVTITGDFTVGSTHVVAFGGVVGGSAGPVNRCYNTGKVACAKGYIGGVVGTNYDAVKGCFFLAGTATDGVGYNNNIVGTIDNIAEKNKAEFANGTVLALLQNDDTSVWTQTTGYLAAAGLTLPLLIWQTADTGHTHALGATLGQCDCGVRMNDGTATNPYQIYTADHLKQFRDLVNSGSNGAHAKLMADITLNDGTFDEDGNYTRGASGKDAERWTPIGSISNPYKDTFDGQGHTIRGMYVTTDYPDDNIGLFGTVNGGTIKNLAVTGYVVGHANYPSHAGGIAGCVHNGTIEGCVNLCRVTVRFVTSCAGGITGIVQNSFIKNCVNLGEISATYDNADGNDVGGIVGMLLFRDMMITGCYNAGRVTNGGGIAGLVFLDDKIVNSYYLAGTAEKAVIIGNMDNAAAAKSKADFADGTVLALLQGGDTNSPWTKTGYLAAAGMTLPLLDWQTADSHTHSYAWKHTDAEHWKECACGLIETGSTAAHSKEWIQTSTTHTQKCKSCGATVVAEENHQWENGACKMCGYKPTYSPTIQRPEITIIGSGKVTLSANGRTATITAEKGYELASITLNGKEIANTDKLTGLKTGDKVVVTFREKSDESAAEIKAVATKVGKMQLIARSSRTAKKNIRITVKADKKTHSLIKEIKDLGYTVKYKYYRSTKKSSKYGAKVEKDASSSSYINTAGKKGTRYYYKVRLMVYDAKGSLVAKTELKQCKYAARIWNK